MSIIVRVIKDWDTPDILYQQTPNNDGVWNNMKFTYDDINCCDYLIAFNRVPKNIKIRCPSGNKWLISGEPPCPPFRWHKRTYKYFDRVFSQWNTLSLKNIKSHGALPWQIDETYTELKKLRPNTQNKLDKVSYITSDKLWLSGHQLRLEFLNYLNSSDLDFHLFGKGFNPVSNKIDALYPYKYSISIENSRYKHYWTDKLIDCFLSWTLPFYYGAPNVNKYFPENSIININPNRPKETIDIIKDAIKNNEWKKRIKYIEEARNLILEKYQIFPFLDEKINKSFINTKLREKKEYYIPRNPAPWEPDGKKLISNYRKLEWRLRKIYNIRPY